MVGIVFAGHGLFPEGLKNSTEMIAGEIEQCQVVSLQPGEDPFEYGSRLQLAIHQTDTGDGVVVLTDLKGGTPFNQSLMLCQSENIRILCGSNLPIALNAVLNRNEKISLDGLSSLLMEDALTAIDLIAFHH